MTRRTHLLLGALMLLLAVAMQAGAVDLRVRATGARRPNARELAIYNRRAVHLTRVSPNGLAMSRAMAERNKGGRPSANGPGIPTVVDNTASNFWPGIGDQAGLGSCASYSTTFYELTYTTAKARNWNVSGGPLNQVFSPKWTYNMINGGEDSGSWTGAAHALFQTNGAPFLSDWLYVGDPSNPANYREWPTTANIWQSAIPYRIDTYGDLPDPVTPTDLTTLKTWLANGNLAVFSTGVSSWQFGTIPAGSPAHAGEAIATHRDGDNGGHAMTIVGYDDTIWTDLNNNAAVDAGETGALLIANQWTSGWGNAGLMWVAYDALTPNTAVTNGPDHAGYGIFWSGSLEWITAKSSYTPRMYAQVTSNSAVRGMTAWRIGVGNVGASAPSTTWNPNYPIFAGGLYAYDGGNLGVDGTFVFDFTDLAPSDGLAHRFFLEGDDTQSTDLTIKDFTLIDAERGNHTIVATGTPVAVNGSALLSVDYSPVTLAFVTQPASVDLGQAIPSFSVKAVDLVGSTVTGYTGNVTATIANNPGSATLAGTTTVAAVNGVATFNTLSLNKAGNGYTLQVAGTGVAPATSNAFNVTQVPVTHLSVTQQPAQAVAGQPIPATKVSLLDHNNNVVTWATNTITVSLGANPGGSTLSGTASVAAVNGVATFSDLSLNKSAIGYTLSLAMSGVPSVVTAAFDVTAAGTAGLAFGQQPVDGVSKATLSAVTVKLLDSLGNTAVGDSSTAVTMSLDPATAPTGAVLSGTTTVTAVKGVATFSTLSINRPGTGLKLRAAIAGPSAVLSTAFNLAVPSPLSSLQIGVQPSATVAGLPIGGATGVQVKLIDGQGNLADWSTASVTVALAANPGSATLSGTTTVAAVNGVATFANLSLSAVATGYTLRFGSGALPAVTSAAFNILPATSASLQFGQQPTAVAAGSAIAPAVTVKLFDAFGNLAASDNSTQVTLTLDSASNPGGAVLGGTSKVTAVAGVATFDALTVTKVGTSYKLKTAFGAGAAVLSSAFDVTPAAATVLAIRQQPGSTAVAGVALSPAPVVEARDAYGNLVTGDNASLISATLSSKTATDVVPPLQGKVKKAVTGGVVTFSDLGVTTVGTTWVLTFSAPGMGSVSTNAFAITPAATASVSVQAQPTTQSTLTALSPAVVVKCVDAFGNLNTADSATAVTASLASNPVTAVLGGTVTATATNGLVSFGGLTVSRVGTFKLLFTSNGGSTATSAEFQITPRLPDPAKCTVALAPSTIAADGTEVATLTLTLLDTNGVPCQGSPAALRSVSAPSAVVVKSVGDVADDQGLALIQVTATTPGNYTLVPKVSDVALASQLLAAKAVFTATLQPGLYCVGLPIYATDGRPSQVLPAGNWRLARYDNPTNTIIEYHADQDDADPRYAFVRGRALWLRAKTATTIHVLGEPTPDQPFDVVLQQGWNNIANPFTASMPWDLNQLAVLVGNSFLPLSNTSTWDLVSPYAWFYNGTANQLVFDPSLPAFSTSLNAVPLMGGIWVYASADNTTLRLVPKSAGSARAAKAASSRDWTIALSASASGGPSARCVVGTSAGLSRELKLRDAPTPVTPDCSVVVLDSAGSRLAGNVRTYVGGPQSFDLAVTSSAAGKVVVSWPSLLRGLANGMNAELTDLTTGKSILLNTATAYTYTATRAAEERRFKLTVQAGHIERSAVTGLSVASGRKIGATIAVTLSGPAEVTLRVKGLGGQLVKETSAQATAAGTLNLAWDGTDQHGRAVPQGTYQIEAVAVSPNGAVSRAQRSVTLR